MFAVLWSHVCTLSSPTFAARAAQRLPPPHTSPTFAPWCCIPCSPTFLPCAPSCLHPAQPHSCTLCTPVFVLLAAPHFYPVPPSACTPCSSVFAPCAAPWQLSPILIPHTRLQWGRGSVPARDAPSLSSTGWGQPAYPEQRKGITDPPCPHPHRHWGHFCHRCHPKSREHPCHPGRTASPIDTQQPGKGMRPQEPRHGTNPGPSRDAGVLAPRPLAGTVPGRCQLQGPGGSTSRVQAGKVLLVLLLLSLLSPDFELDNEGARLSERCWR